ncbi:MAG TPA: toxin-antitoxin system HicB family antitoxin [Acidobacteria bacterium]|nr:toxin-antitoxin system HicB family antitoxin [Acidobacteriota bacterium]
MGVRKNYPLRLDPELYEALRRWADDEMRSVNAQIEFLLARALRQAGRAPQRPPAGNEAEDG